MRNVLLLPCLGSANTIEYHASCKAALPRQQPKLSGMLAIAVTMSILMPIDLYFSELRSALAGHPAYFYPDKGLRRTNCLKLARDIGYGLRDYPLGERYNFLQNAYGALFVANCLDACGVPLSMKEMTDAAASQWSDLGPNHSAGRKVKRAILIAP